MKEKKKNTTTVCGNVVVNDNEALISRLLDFYNNNTTLKTIFSLSDYEKSCLITLNQQYGEEVIKQGFLKADASDFLSGRKGCDWSPDFRWIVTLRNFQNILNGKYDDFSYNQPYRQATQVTASGQFNGQGNNAQRRFEAPCSANNFAQFRAKNAKPPEVSLSSIPDDMFDEFVKAAEARAFDDW